MTTTPPTVATPSTSAGAGPTQDGILYPRAAALGGCTAHNAMIWVYPHDADWDAIAAATGDDSWSAASMRRLFQKIENCRHRPVHRWLARLGIDVTGHGWRGWLPVEHAVPWEALTDTRLRRVVIDAGIAAMRLAPRSAGSPPLVLDRVVRSERPAPDPRQRQRHSLRAAHDRSAPSRRHARAIARRAGSVSRSTHHPARDAGHARPAGRPADGRTASSSDAARACTGRTSHRAPSAGEVGEAYASREVILSGGAFNTPQLLMLSGIGPSGRAARARHHRAGGAAWRGTQPAGPLRGQRRLAHGLSRVAHLPRRHVPRVAMPPTAAGMTAGAGLYATNGAVLTVFTRSTVAGTLPDLFVMAMVARFDGYAPGVLGEPRHRTQLPVLGRAEGAHEEHRRRGDAEERRPAAIRRTSTSASGWTAAPTICRAVADGVRFVRRLNDRLRAYGNTRHRGRAGPGGRDR